MANKLTSWVMTVIGALLLLQAAGLLTALTQYNTWLIGLGWLVVGIAKLTRAYK